MITFFHVIISLLSGLGNTAAACLWHPGEDWRGEKAEGGVVTKTARFSWGFHVDVFQRFRPRVQFVGQIEEPALMVKFDCEMAGSG